MKKKSIQSLNQKIKFILISANVFKLLYKFMLNDETKTQFDI